MEMQVHLNASLWSFVSNISNACLLLLRVQADTAFENMIGHFIFKYGAFWKYCQNGKFRMEYIMLFQTATPEYYFKKKIFSDHLGVAT